MWDWLDWSGWNGTSCILSLDERSDEDNNRRFVFDNWFGDDNWFEEDDNWLEEEEVRVADEDDGKVGDCSVVKSSWLSPVVDALRLLSEDNESDDESSFDGHNLKIILAVHPSWLQLQE